tara:strand:- start:1410 stop:2822 length:1413 start_codon:yes stop_codon:yes gene_type:complete
MLLNSILIKSISSALSLALNLILLFFLSNFLSKFEFGLFNYLTTIGSLLIFILTSGFSRSFVHFYSQNILIKKEVVETYININILIILLFIILVQVINFNKFLNDLIFEKKIEYLLINLGLLSGLLNYTFEKVGEIYDADQLSAKFDYIKLILRAMTALTVVLLYFLNFLDLIILLFSIIILNFISILILLKKYYTSKIIINISILKNLSSYYFMFAPFTILIGLYELLYRVVISSDLGIENQGVYGFAFLIFAASSTPFHSVSNILLSYASRNKIVFSTEKINNYYLICNSIIIPLLVIISSLICVYYNYFINFLSNSTFEISNLSLFGLFLWCVLSTYDILIYSSIISTDNFKKYLNLGIFSSIMLILILVVFLHFGFHFNLEFYFLFLCIAPLIRLIVGVILGYLHFGSEMLFNIHQTLFYFIICCTSLILFHAYESFILTTFMIFIAFLIWFYNLLIIDKVRLNLK